MGGAQEPGAITKSCGQEFHRLHLLDKGIFPTESSDPQYPGSLVAQKRISAGPPPLSPTIALLIHNRGKELHIFQSSLGVLRPGGAGQGRGGQAVAGPQWCGVETGGNLWPPGQGQDSLGRWQALFWADFRAAQVTSAKQPTSAGRKVSPDFPWKVCPSPLLKAQWKECAPPTPASAGDFPPRRPCHWGGGGVGGQSSQELRARPGVAVPCPPPPRAQGQGRACCARPEGPDWSSTPQGSTRCLGGTQEGPQGAKGC